MRITLVTNRAELLPHVEKWDDLARHAIEPNVFYESWLYLPALKHYPDQDEKQPLTVLVWNGNQLIGLVPLQNCRHYRGIPYAHLRSWEYLHCYLSTPLVRRGSEEAFFESFFEWLDRQCAGPNLIEFRSQNCSGEFHKALQKWCLSTGRNCELTSSHSRALLEAGLDAETYLRTAVSGKRRKEFKRQSNRLSELGNLSTSVIDSPHDCARWISSFLALERSGWKGSAGALDLTDSGREFFRSIVQAGLERGQLNMLALELDDRLLAMQINLFSGKGSFSFKIAYDEEFSKFSPGVLIELKNLESTLANKSIAWMDSCAAPDHPMINGLWSARRRIGNLVVARRGKLAGLAVQIIGGAHRMLQIYRGSNRDQRGYYEVAQS